MLDAVKKKTFRCCTAARVTDSEAKRCSHVGVAATIVPAAPAR